MPSFSASSADELTSPARSITETPSRLRTAASELTRLISASFQAHDELDGAPAASLVTCASSTIFSIRNRPQPRGFWRPSSFASRSGRLGLGELAGVAVVGDLHAQRDPSRRTRIDTGRSAPVLVAVLHRVHRGLGHRRLQPLEARRPRPRSATACRPAPSRCARCRARSAARSRRARSRSRPATLDARRRSAGA